MYNKMLTPECVAHLNRITNSVNYKIIINRYGLEPSLTHNSYATLGHDGAVVRGVAPNGDVLIHTHMEGWEVLSESEWIESLFNKTFEGYSYKTKLMFIRTVPYLKDYEPGITIQDGEA